MILGSLLGTRHQLCDTADANGSLPEAKFCDDCRVHADQTCGFWGHVVGFAKFVSRHGIVLKHLLLTVNLGIFVSRRGE